MQNFNKLLIENLNTQTALLEAFSWDDTVLNEFNEYFKQQLAITQNPNVLLINIKDQFGEVAESIVKSLFREIYIEHGLYLDPIRDEDEH